MHLYGETTNKNAYFINNNIDIINICCDFIIRSGSYRVDYKSIAISMLRNPTRPTARKYLEFIINRAACARDGEHLWLRYNEATYD